MHICFIHIYAYSIYIYMYTWIHTQRNIYIGALVHKLSHTFIPWAWWRWLCLCSYGKHDCCLVYHITQNWQTKTKFWQMLLFWNQIAKTNKKQCICEPRYHYISYYSLYEKYTWTLQTHILIHIPSTQIYTYINTDAYVSIHILNYGWTPINLNQNDLGCFHGFESLTESIGEGHVA